MSGIIAGLSGAGGAANAVGSYYGNAENQLVNAYGSPAANQFASEYIASLQPGFEEQGKNLIAQENALGIANSGAAKANLQELASGQSAAEAQGVAPLYGQALGQYGQLLGTGAGAQAGAYQGAIQDFYQGMGGLANAAAEAFGAPPVFGGGGGGGDNPYGPASQGGYGTYGGIEAMP